MPKGVSPEQHDEFNQLARALMANGVPLDHIARAVGYSSASAIEHVLAGNNPPTIGRLRRLRAYTHSAPTPPDVPVSIDHAVLYLMGVWFYLDGQLDDGDIPAMLAPGYEQARDRVAELIDFMGGDKAKMARIIQHTTAQNDNGAGHDDDA